MYELLLDCDLKDTTIINFSYSSHRVAFIASILKSIFCSRRVGAVILSLASEQNATRLESWMKMALHKGNGHPRANALSKVIGGTRHGLRLLEA